MPAGRQDRAGVGVAAVIKSDQSALDNSHSTHLGIGNRLQAILP